MMNVLAISLVLSTLVTAGFFNPNPQNNKKEDVVLVVEFDKDDGTKVLISPQEAGIPEGKSRSGYVSDLKDRLYEKAEGASSVLPNIDQGISSPFVNQENGEYHTKTSSGDVVCDSFGKCKEKIASALGKTKDKLYEKTEGASSVLPNIGQGISSPLVNEDQENCEYHTKPSAGDVVCDAFGKCKEKIASALGKTKDKVSEKFHEGAKGTAEKVKDAVEEVKEKAKDVVDTTKRKKAEMGQDASREMKHTKGEISEKAKKLEEKTEQVKDSVKEGASKVKEEGKKELKDILEGGREFFCDVFVYIFSLENLRPVMRLAHFLGFAVAYGMCIWVTFVSSYVLARALPRHQFAVIQSKIYPVYFKAMAYCVGAAFLGHLLSQKRRLYANSAEAVQGFNLLASISMLLVNLLCLEPRATKLMFERLKLEKEEGRGREMFNVEPSSRADSVLDPTVTKTTATEKSAEAKVVKLREKLKKLNSYSSFLNVLTLMALSHHLVHLTQLLDASS